jgi:hypothetical protein
MENNICIRDLIRIALVTGFLGLTLLSNASVNLPDSLKLKDRKQHFSISGNYQRGNIIPTTDFVKGDNLAGHPIEKYENYSLKVLWQNPGNTDWQKVFRVPYYGFGLSVGNFYNPLEIGYPVSIYGVLGIPVFRVNKFELYYEMQFGTAFNWVKYDSITNPKKPGDWRWNDCSPESWTERFLSGNQKP